VHTVNVAENVDILVVLLFHIYHVFFVCGRQALYRLESSRPVLNTVDCLTSNRLIRLPGMCVSVRVRVSEGVFVCVSTQHAVMTQPTVPVQL